MPQQPRRFLHEIPVLLYESPRSRRRSRTKSRCLCTKARRSRAKAALLARGPVFLSEIGGLTVLSENRVPVIFEELGAADSGFGKWLNFDSSRSARSGFVVRASCVLRGNVLSVAR